MASANNIEQLRKARGWSRPELGKRMGTSGQQVERLEKDQRRLTRDWIDKAAAAFGVEATVIISATMPEVAAPGVEPPAADLAEGEIVGAGLPMVEISRIDLAYGLGATFTDGAVEVEVLQFPRVWVEDITSSPPALLTWSRGRGDSMHPTIGDGDLVLLDRSQRRVIEQDALWAFTVGDVGAIKRLRRKGDRMVILSDNPSVPPDEEPIDLVNIVARVVFIGKRT